MSKTAVISGGAGGLGTALSAQLRASGWHTVLIDLPGPQLEAQKGIENQSCFACDITDSATLAKVCEDLIVSRPTIDLVIYNAGITHIGLFGETEMASHRRVFEINYFAAVDMARHFLQPLRNSRGTHMAISSVAGFSPLYKRTAYAGSKHALEGFFKSLRSEEKDHGVTTLIAAPSFVATNIGNPEKTEDGIARPGSASDGVDYMTPDKAAEVILQGYKKKTENVPVGRIAKLSYIINRVSPKLFARLMEKNIKSEEIT